MSLTCTACGRDLRADPARTCGRGEQCPVNPGVVREWHEFDCGALFGDKPHWHLVQKFDPDERLRTLEGLFAGIVAVRRLWTEERVGNNPELFLRSLDLLLRAASGVSCSELSDPRDTVSLQRSTDTA